MNLFEVLFQQGCKNGPKNPEKTKKKKKKDGQIMKII